MSFFVLRREHMAAFEAVAEEQLVSDIVTVLRREHGAVTDRMRDEPLRQRVRVGLARARARGLVLDTALTAFVVLMFEVSPTFDDHPAISAVLLAGPGTPDQRFFALGTRMPDTAWKEAAEESDLGTWWRDD